MSFRVIRTKFHTLQLPLSSAIQSCIPLKGYYECVSLGRSLGFAQSQFSFPSNSVKAQVVNCGSDAWHLLPSPLFIAALPRTTTRSPIPVHVLCEGPGPERTGGCATHERR